MSNKKVQKIVVFLMLAVMLLTTLLTGLAMWI
ncbi:stressosome-associated protein Prli42 [Priestia koreensis]|nr:stressosome-associated protein Prli42 [Priestia koreensis]MCM3002393.1 stressosome-associated protein Prli42 [Priestia koreensis]UNL84117.1 stressosome-associated protein Prli42 [Priestia koreensis]